MTIIVDDFGYSHEVNLLVQEGFRVGAIDGAALMVNRPGTDEALVYARNSTKLIGLHLNITEGKPMLPVSQVPTLVDASGSFFHWPTLIRRLISGSVKQAELLAETEAQLKLFANRRQPDFFNSHHHVHLFPDLFAPLADLAADFGIKRIRAPRSMWWPSLRLPQAAKALTIQLLGRSRSVTELQPVATQLVDLDWADQRPAALTTLFATIPADTELICHPHPAPSTLQWLIDQKGAHGA